MNHKSPFKDKKLLIWEINNFLEKYGSTLIQHASKISTYFEISCYNYIIKYYENSGFTVQVKNLDEKTRSFKYKLGPLGHPHNFSYFIVSRTYRYRKNPKTFQYEIRHNIPVQSKHDSNIFITPDIVICENNIASKKDWRYYRGMRKLYFIPNESLISFAEAKHYNPSPEMIINFIGIVNELMPSLLKKKNKSNRPAHIAPSLIVSGKGGYHTNLIKRSLQNRYSVNIFLGVFSSSAQIYSKYRRSEVITI